MQKQSEQKMGIDPGQLVEITMDKVLFEWIPMHYERTGSGCRSRKKDENGHRHHGYAVQVLQDGVVIEDACSHPSLQKAE